MKALYIVGSSRQILDDEILFRCDSFVDALMCVPQCVDAKTYEYSDHMGIFIERIIVSGEYSVVSKEEIYYISINNDERGALKWNYKLDR